MNIVNLIGKVVYDIEVKQNSKYVYANLVLNVEKTYNEKTFNNFIRCVAFGKTTEILSKYVRKNDLIGVEGTLDSSSYVDKNTGVTVNQVVVTIKNVTLLSPKGVDYKNVNNIRPETFEKPSEKNADDPFANVKMSNKVSDGVMPF